MKQPLLTLSIILICNACTISAKEYFNYKKPLPDLFKEMKIEADECSIIISKSAYKLSLVKDDTVIKEYPVVFGGNAIDDKLRQGDQCTPEGSFKMVSKYPHQNWSKFIWINYPTPDSWKKHKQAKADGKISSSAKIGGEIGIHGVPENCDYLIDNRQNWTLGCVALKNADINELYPYVLETTEIRIIK